MITLHNAHDNLMDGDVAEVTEENGVVCFTITKATH